MKRVAVTSSVLRSVGYDARARVLEAEFADGDVYRYFAVPRRQYESLLAAESLGEYFNVHIKGDQYRFEKKQ